MPVDAPRLAGGRDDIERAHLLDPEDRSFTIARYPVSPDLDDLARRFWVPVWDVPPGVRAPQRVLQYPVCLVVISNTYARFYGVMSGVSETVLEGHGWAVGVMLQPAAGYAASQAPVRRLTDRWVELADVAGLPGTGLTREVRAAMAADPESAEAHTTARRAVEAALRPLLPVDEEGLLVNAVVGHVEHTPDLLRVEELCARFDISERALQRLLSRRIGLSPTWLIRRRRLHEAADRLRDAGPSLSGIAADLGYADQPHFTRDFKAATGLTPGQFAARFR